MLNEREVIETQKRLNRWKKLAYAYYKWLGNHFQTAFSMQ
jgi:hypothetical protein